MTRIPLTNQAIFVGLRRAAARQAEYDEILADEMGVIVI